MFNFRKGNIIFLGIFLMLLLTGIFFSHHILPFFILLLSYLLWLGIGVFSLKKGMFIHAHVEGDPDSHSIALTFDDGPATSTEEILDILKQQGITATFFCIGSHIQDHPELLKRIDREGHIIGNHAFRHHVFFPFKSARQIHIELQLTHNLIVSSIGRSPKFFRPPYGVSNPAIARASKQMSYHTIGWSIRSFDTLIKNKVRLLKRLKRKVKPGSVILFHDNREHTPAVLSAFLQFVQSNGLRVERLDKMLNIQAYENE